MRKPLRFDEEYNEYVKSFYRKIEDYDWNYVTDQRIGLECFVHRAREKRMKQLIQKYGCGNKYLDAGCGTGLILRHLPPGSIGIDLNPRHLARARKYVPRAALQIGDVEHLEFPANTFSTIVCTETLEHLVFPEKAIAEMKRVLQPGGILIGSTPRKSLIWKFRFLSSTHYHNEPFHNEFTKEELRELLHDFRIIYFKTGFFNSIFFFVIERN